MSLSRTKKILLIVVAILVAWLVAWTVGAAFPLDQESHIGPTTRR